MMDLTVEIHGDAASLEECLEQFTAKECLNGENMYKCDCCNDYVKAWKRLSVEACSKYSYNCLKKISGFYDSVVRMVDSHKCKFVNG
ncbi:hypothetical protein CMV_006071 [Castanea mollissima]|uniref:Uncharacterized protein n=1 Tax=Castanea mollissima TaxID=60419 RepID=A0A8J4RBD0_9ROSI|nr:hypothetical protein CMV_006071 [Castanea mollissima]